MLNNNLENQTEETKKQESSSGPTYADENQNKKPSLDELFERHKVANSPFEIVGNKERGFCMRMGKYKLTNQFDTVAECLQYTETNLWDFITTLIFTMIEAHKELDKLDQTNKTISETE